MKILKIALAQSRQSPDFNTNRQTILCFIEKAADSETQILCFPETQTIGYRVDITPTKTPVDPSKLNHLHQEVAQLCKKYKMACILGTETPLESDPIHGKPYNTA